MFKLLPPLLKDYLAISSSGSKGKIVNLRLKQA